ncbi:hypothetical protein F4678DRAFT_433726 [Xylaria arbuscula]|nr:hypothetical protein F4678DRAFT_433726 [Xylaria arbuscula]
MTSPHEAFKALGPVDWESFAQEDATTLMTDIFSNARCLVDSVPGQDDSRPSQPTAEALSKEWKEVKVNARDNPFGLHLYKQPAKDGRGAWFARRSVHDGQSFRRWKIGMEREFDESLKVQGEPGDGKIRGLGADKRVVDQTFDGRGKMQVYQLSAQFPGPTSPRDFVTLCLSSDTPITTPVPDEPSTPRSYMLVSKPCVHPECPERQGFVRGYYESVELIREIKAEKPLHSPASSASLASKDPTPSAPTSSSNLGAALSISSNGEPTSTDRDSHDNSESTIEWIMITRSDPGGSVPRFLIEKKTPEGIATDANKFVQWVSSDEFETLLDRNFVSAPTEARATPSVAQDSIAFSNPPKSTSTLPSDARIESRPGQGNSEPARSPGPGGVYGMISGALGIVASAAASRFLGPPEDVESESDVSTSDASDASSSIHSFHSFDAKDAEPSAETVDDEDPAISLSTEADGNSMNSARSPHQDKEFMKNEERKRKAEEKLRRAEERALAKKSNDAQRDQLALQKLREKYERGVAKQEEKYQRERRKLEAKQAAEEKNAEERRRKQLEREDKAGLVLELDKTRAERDVARKEVEFLQEQIKQQQALNTKLVARLSREGIVVDDSLAPSSGSGGGLSASSLSPSMVEQDLKK